MLAHLLVGCHPNLLVGCHPNVCGCKEFRLRPCRLLL
jgi:hypothetical protein